jgi:hypothetical protein
MSTDSNRGPRTARIECTLNHDPRLLSGVTAVVAHVARRAGLSERVGANISAAAAEACREAFLGLNSQAAPPSSVKLVAVDFADRVEVTIETAAQTLPVASPRAPRESAGTRTGEGIGKSLEGDLVDRVERETLSGRSRVTLVKYCDAAKSPPKA